MKLILFGVVAMLIPALCVVVYELLAMPKRRLRRGRLLSTLHDDAAGVTHNSLALGTRCECCLRPNVNLVVRNRGFHDMPVCGGCVSEAFPHVDELAERRKSKRVPLDAPDSPAKKMPTF